MFLKRFKKSSGTLNIDELISRKESLMRELLSVVDYEPNLDIHLQGDENSCCLLNQRCSNAESQPLGTKGKVGIPYLVTDERGHKYVTKISNYSGKVVYSDDPPVTVDAPESDCISSEFKEMRYLGLGEFSNEFCVGIVVEQAFMRYDMKGKYFGVKYEGATVCDGKGIHITDYASLGDLKSLADNDIYATDYNVTDVNGAYVIKLVYPSVVTNILSQVVAAVHYLDETIQFRSNDLKVENVFIEPVLVTGRYGTLIFSDKYNQPLTCKIADYGKSSCTYTTVSGKRIRIYNWSNLSAPYLTVANFNPDIRAYNGKPYYVVDDYFIAQTYVYERHMGVPYYKSFDYYTFILSLLSLSAYYNIFFSQDMIYEKARFWDILWEDINDRIKMEGRVRKVMLKGKRPSHKRMIKMLRGVKLLCGVLDDIVYFLPKDQWLNSSQK